MDVLVPIVVVLFALVFFILRGKPVHKTQRFSCVPTRDFNHLMKLRSGEYSFGIFALSDPPPGKWDNFEAPTLITHQIQSTVVQLRPGLTFTPYADALPCTAHCHFCSETLVRANQTAGNSTPYDLPKLRQRPLDHTEYFSALEKVFMELNRIPFPVGLSLSGLEATADKAWLLRLCEILSRTSLSTIFDEKVIYSNGSGLVGDPALTAALRRAGFDRVELSRQHYDEKQNQKIMRFDSKIAIRHNKVYEELVRNLTSSSSPKLRVKNSCILNRSGISSVTEIERYVSWAKGLGVTLCVFRELSQLSSGSDGYSQNRTKTWNDDNRVSMENIVSELVFQEGDDWVTRKDWNFLCSSIGYYYYNEHWMFHGVEVIVEVSSYHALESALKTRAHVVDKLVFHSNGNLTSGWDPDKNALAHFEVSGQVSMAW